MKTNGNGMVVSDMMTYDDLYRCLELDRNEMIEVLVESRVQAYIEYDGLIESLQNLYSINGIHMEPEFYLQDDSILYDALFSGVKEVYNNRSNQEIVDYYRENEPYVFGMADSLQKLFER